MGDVTPRKPSPAPTGHRTATATTTTTTTTTRTLAWLPTPLERVALGVFPLILVFGTVFSVLSPETRAAAYDPVAQAQAQDPGAAPSYFARKSNIFNVVFVKRGWGWTTLAFVFFALTHPSGGPTPLELTARRLRAGVRWVLVTGWWILITQWCFGAPIIDRGFRWTGGRCEVVMREAEAGEGGRRPGEVITAVACKAAGGRWQGGHDISGHVFLLVLGTAFLMHEVGWAALRWSGRVREERCVVMRDGALKSAGVEADEAPGRGGGSTELGAGGKTAVAVAALNLWMLLMTAIYFHTWFEKLTGLVTALIGVYAVYYVPRFVPAPPPLILAIGLTAYSQPPSTMSRAIRAPANLPELVKAAFARARQDGDLHFFPTQVTVLPVGPVPFQLRFSPALANKPKAPSPPAGSSRPSPSDPFADPPRALFVADLGPAHYLVLNKFAVVPEHFILATRAFEHQTHVLDEADLEAAMACVRAYDDADAGELFVFFNCGEHSGASQPHRHLQLLPVRRMRDGLSEGEEKEQQEGVRRGEGTAWDVLADTADLAGVPFATFSEDIHLGMSSKDLFAAYLRLYRRACRAVATHGGAAATDGGQEAEAPAAGPTRISYNMAMTRRRLVVCPRLAEGDLVRNGDTPAGRLALNGTVLAGTALVKTEAEWDALRKDPEQLAAVLARIGLPRRAGEADGTRL
ncbi:FIT family protein scs3 [Purpureocillium lavendulum]|uniref:Acyl-coenzyme A diphosphatase SCS3 n=1 Tax=Purpureocillium lavendulum TaxID=1247861 RepID=A0AB34G590_9HYPO|nr:FIT family protein scs3 [Purpureocillium lavendulum]